MESNIYKKLFEVKKAWIKLQRDTKAHNYQYATLSQIQEKLNIELEKQGLLVVHYIEENMVITEIRDIESESWVRSWISLTEWTKAQDKWSEITYYRRYNLLSLLDLEVEDTDASFCRDDKKETTTSTNIYTMTVKDIDLWEWKIYWKSIYLNWEKKIISDEQIVKLKAHEKYVELPPKK